MMRGARTVRRGHFAMIALGLAKCALRALRRPASQACRERADAPARRPDRSLAMPAALQRLARQIEPPERRILVEVAQDVGELQRAAEMMGERDARRPRPCRTRAPKAGRPRSRRGRNRGRASAQSGARMSATTSISMPSMTAMEILALADRMRAPPAQGRRARGGAAAAVERVDIGAPALRAARAARSRGPGVVGDVVDRAAERIDLEHRLALRARQDAHRGVERAAGGALGAAGCGLGARSLTHLAASATGASDAGRHGATRRGRTPAMAQRGDCGLAEMHALAQRIARLQQRDEAMRERGG